LITILNKLKKVVNIINVYYLPLNTYVKIKS